MRGLEPHDPWCVAELPRSSDLRRIGDPADSGLDGSKTPRRRGGNLIGKAVFAQIEFATDSLLEGTGFELLVPLRDFAA